MKFLTSGKVKDVFDLDDGNILFKFSNRVSAYDVKFKDEIPKKGEVLCKFAEFWFDRLDVRNHFVERKSDTEIIVKKMNMLPIECIVRGYFYGSMVSRWKSGQISFGDNVEKELASKLPKQIFDPTTKSTHDIPINKDEECCIGIIDDDFHHKNKGYDYNKLLQKINLLELPVSVYKSKTGGAHIVLHFDKWYPIKDVRHILKKFAYQLIPGNLIS